MLVINRLFARARAANSDDGVALVAVLIVMFVGFVAAAAVAAAVIFVIGNNSDNKSQTQAFIAAESGRDKVVSQIAGGCTSVGALDASSTSAPIFSAHAYTTVGAEPTGPSGMAQTCPTADTTYVLIRSTGSGPDGSTTTIDSIYRWSASYSDVPGGVVTYFSGSVTQGVSHYTGDLVLRNGDWSCNTDGVLDGDLYVLSGTVTLSNNCVINGDIWAAKQVTSNSQSWQVNANSASGSTGSITTNGYVNFTANGSPSVAGAITAKGTVTLDAGGGGAGTVGGKVTSTAGMPSVNAAWTTGPTATSTTNPVFVPTLEWLREATKWIDLNSTSGWGPATSPPCSVLQNGNSALSYIKPLLNGGTSPLVLDFTGCPSSQALSLSLTGGASLTRDVAIIIDSRSKMTVDAGGLTASSVHQLMLIHSDGSLDDRDADGAPEPTCIGGGDSFDTSAAISSNVHVMVYTPCGLTGTVTASFSGQLYANDTTHFHSGSAYTCTAMSWPSALPNLGCKIKGDGGISDTTTVTQELGNLVRQVEVRAP